MNSIRTFAIAIAVPMLLVATGSLSQAQENDPTAKSEIINKTMSKIRDVEKLDAFVKQNSELRTQNAKLKSEVASIKQQLAKLKADFEQQNAKIRKQLLQMPTFQVQSKVIAGKNSVAYLKTKNTSLRIRAHSEMSVAVADGVWVLMQVKEISKDMIVLEFPELDRTVYLYH